MRSVIWEPFDSLDCPFLALGFVTSIPFPQSMADMSRDLWIYLAQPETLEQGAQACTQAASPRRRPHNISRQPEAHFQRAI